MSVPATNDYVINLLQQFPYVQSLLVERDQLREEVRNLTQTFRLIAKSVTESAAPVVVGSTTGAAAPALSPETDALIRGLEAKIERLTAQLNKPVAAPPAATPAAVALPNFGQLETNLEANLAEFKTTLLNQQERHQEIMQDEWKAFITSFANSAPRMAVEAVGVVGEMREQVHDRASRAAASEGEQGEKRVALRDAGEVSSSSPVEESEEYVDDGEHACAGEDMLVEEPETEEVVEETEEVIEEEVVEETVEETVEEATDAAEEAAEDDLVEFVTAHPASKTEITLCTSDAQNGILYTLTEEGAVGDEFGIVLDGVAYFTEVINDKTYYSNVEGVIYAAAADPEEYVDVKRVVGKYIGGKPTLVPAKPALKAPVKVVGAAAPAVVKKPAVAAR